MPSSNVQHEAGTPYTTNTPITVNEFRQIVYAMADEFLYGVPKEYCSQRMRDAYKAVRVASVTTQEEALFIELARLEMPHPSGVPLSKETIESRTADIIGAIRKHGRWLIAGSPANETRPVEPPTGEWED